MLHFQHARKDASTCTIMTFMGITNYFLTVLRAQSTEGNSHPTTVNSQKLTAGKVIDSSRETTVAVLLNGCDMSVNLFLSIYVSIRRYYCCHP